MHKKDIIAFYQASTVFAGAEECLLFNAVELRQRGLDVVIFAGSAPAVVGRFAEAGVPVEKLFERPPQSGWRKVLGRLAVSLECRSKHLHNRMTDLVSNLVSTRELGALRRAIGRVGPTVLVGNMSALGDYQFLRLAARLGLGTISHQQLAPEPWVGGRVVGETSRFCTEIYSNSRWTREQWIAQGLRADRHHVIYNRIVPTLETGEDLRKRLGLEARARLIASMGRLAPEKRFQDGIKAFAAIGARHPGWHYVIMGEGSERPGLEEVAAGSGLGERIHFAGQIRNGASCLAQCDVFVHPTPGEHFGRVVAEAMLRGAVAVGHRSGGVPEMITDGETGFLFDAGQSLERALERALTAAGDAALHKTARARIEELCGTSNTDKLVGLIENASRAARRRPM